MRAVTPACRRAGLRAAEFSTCTRRVVPGTPCARGVCVFAKKSKHSVRLAMRLVFICKPRSRIRYSPKSIFRGTVVRTARGTLWRDANDLQVPNFNWNSDGWNFNLNFWNDDWNQGNYIVLFRYCFIFPLLSRGSFVSRADCATHRASVPLPRAARRA